MKSSVYFDKTQLILRDKIVDSDEKKEAQIQGYMRMEEMRGFKKDEASLRITQFRMDETKSELLLTWNERYMSEIAVNWLCEKD